MIVQASIDTHTVKHLLSTKQCILEWPHWAAVSSDKLNATATVWMLKLQYEQGTGTHYNPTYISYNSTLTMIPVGWGCILNCFILPCFPPFCWSAIPTSPYISNVFCLGTGVPRHRDGVVRLYVRTYVFSELCSIFQYVIKRLCARCS